MTLVGVTTDTNDVKRELTVERNAVISALPNPVASATFPDMPKRLGTGVDPATEFIRRHIMSRLGSGLTKQDVSRELAVRHPFVIDHVAAYEAGSPTPRASQDTIKKFADRFFAGSIVAFQQAAERGYEEWNGKPLGPGDHSDVILIARELMAEGATEAEAFSVAGRVALANPGASPQRLMRLALRTLEADNQPPKVTFLPTAGARTATDGPQQIQLDVTVASKQLAQAARDAGGIATQKTRVGKRPKHAR